MKSEEPLICRRDGRSCDLRYSYDLELESGTYPVQWFRCPACREEYLHAPELLRPEDVVEAGASPVGTFRRIGLGHTTAPEVSDEAGGRSVGPLVATAVDEGIVDAVLLPDYGDAGVLVITEPEEATGLRRAWSTPSRSIPVNARLGANLDLLLELERFARRDGGAHRRLGIVGRPCHVFVARRANLATIAPGYEIGLALGLFCYGNVSPTGSLALRFEKLTGLPPAQIRGMTAEAGIVRIESGGRRAAEVPLIEFESFLHRSCVKCVDFTAPWADLSLGQDPRADAFDTILVRTEAGEKLLDRAVATGRLRMWSPPWMEGGGESLQVLAGIGRLKRALAHMEALPG